MLKIDRNPAEVAADFQTVLSTPFCNFRSAGKQQENCPIAKCLRGFLYLLNLMT